MRCPSKPAKFIGIGFLVVFGIFAIGSVIMLLWNELIPTLFNGPLITYWQALGLLILSKILFSSGHSGSRHDKHSKHTPWKSHLREKIELKHNENIATEEGSPSTSDDNEIG
ncbi:MAG: hypothetical protein K9M55_04180 [Candidatus Marinimicrobia bacterium]|nr:hypothetical protein [Candidatus Neomarinimicrobiota bacterium]MCF7921879.1 hypothetical protein [Candidatus Neomarinimicrobiota bacterium]